jgi:hypothetical protein
MNVVVGYYNFVTVGIQNTLPGSQGNPTLSAARSAAKLRIK